MSYILLFCFTWVMLPRDWTHDCDHTDIHSHDHEQTELSEDCQICDFEFAPYVTVDDAALNAAPQQQCAVSCGEVTVLPMQVLLGKEGRAPPVIA
jgi:hypothetical protein